MLLSGVLAGCAASASQKEPETTTGGLSSLLPFASSTPKGPAKTVSGLPIAGELARSFDDKDRELFSTAQFEALENGAAGASREWSNPANDHGGTITPGPAYSVNQYSCRDFSQRIFIGSKTEVVRGTACRQPDGTWRSIG